MSCKLIAMPAINRSFPFFVSGTISQGVGTSTRRAFESTMTRVIEDILRPLLVPRWLPPSNPLVHIDCSEVS